MGSARGDFDGDVFNDGVAEEVAADFFEFGFGFGEVVAVDLEVDDFADAGGGDAVHAELVDGALNGFALRVENGLLGGDDDGGVKHGIRH